MTAGQGTAPGPARRLDESMTLLREVMERPLDPGYAAAAARRARQREGHQRARTTTLRTALTMALAVLAGLGLASSVLALRQPADTAATVRRGLQTRIEDRDTAIRKQADRNTRLRARIAAAQQAALGASGQQLRDQQRALGAETGELPVSGPGVRITVADAPSAARDVGGDPRTDTGSDAGTVLDADLQAVVNGLWAAGAEAIAVNGQRLSGLSAIRSAGRAILVDFRPLSPPYQIDAVGDPARLQSRFAAGAAGAYVQSLRNNNDIGVSIDPRGTLRLPAAGQLTLHVAHEPAAAR